MSTDLTGGDATPKLAKASIKDLTLAVNLISYTFKTPDSMVAPDALQLAGDGNLALGNVPKAYITTGRNFAVLNNSIAGGTAASSSVTIESNSGLATLSLKTGSGVSGVIHWDGNSSTVPAAQAIWSPTENLWRLQTATGAVQKTGLKVNKSGQVGIGESAPMQALLNVGEPGGTNNEVYIASNTTTFEGVFIGAYDNRSGAKLDLNAQANATNVSSWRISHDLNDGGQGRLSFRLAAAATSRVGLTYTERAAFTATNYLFGAASPRNVGGAVRTFQIENTGLTSISLVNNSNDVNGCAISIGKTRGTSIGSSTIVQDGDTIGVIQWAGANGTDVSKAAAQITCLVSGAPSATGIPGALVFSTTKVGDAGISEAMRITNQQNVAIGGSSDVAKLVIIKGVTYPTGENLIYLQSSSPSTVPVMITGSSSGTTSISGGAALASGGARGGQIDLIGGGANLYAGHAVIRTGTNADGVPGSNVFTFTPAGMFGVNAMAVPHRIYALGAQGERIRVMMDTIGEYAGFTARRANGTAAVPTKILAGDQIGFFNVHGYSGTAYVGSCGSMNIIAEQDWSDTNSPTSFVFAPGATGNLGQNNRMIITSFGKVGVNAMTPVSIFNVTHPAAPSGVGFEVDPDTSTAFVQLRSYDRSLSQYKGWAQAASSFVWGVGSSSAALIMSLTPGNNLVVGQNAQLYVNGQGTGNTMIDGQFILSAYSYSSTALCITAGEKYAGLKIKVGPSNNPNGGADYFDITTRPGASGVATNADYVMIRMESAVSKTNPDMYLQTSGAGGRVVIGSDTPTLQTRLNVVGFTGGGNVASFSGNTTSVANADIVVTRAGAVSSTLAGKGSSIQLSNGTNNSHILFQENDNGLQLFNFTSGAWGERMYMANTGRFTIGAHSSAAGTTAETMQVIGGATGGNEYCYFAQANTGNQAYAMRMFSVTANQLVGSITFTGSSTAFNTTSDRRLKENIVASPFASDILRAIDVRSFNFINGGEFTKYGFIAQELMNAAPWAVHVGSDNNAEMDGLNGIWGVDNSKLVPLIVKSQQETIDELRDTKTKLSDAQARIASLERTMTHVLQLLEDLKKEKSA